MYSRQKRGEALPLSTHNTCFLRRKNTKSKPNTFCAYRLRSQPSFRPTWLN